MNFSKELSFGWGNISLRFRERSHIKNRFEKNKFVTYYTHATQFDSRVDGKRLRIRANGQWINILKHIDP